MANWEATLLNGVLSTGTVLVFARDKLEESEVPRLRMADTFYGSAPDGNPFGGTVVEMHDGRAVVEVNQKRHPMHRAQAHESNYDFKVDLPHEYWVLD
jgi:hypothetical protein